MFCIIVAIIMNNCTVFLFQYFFLFVYRCSRPNYMPSRNPITKHAAANLLLETLHGLYLYKHPEKYTSAMSTHYVESFNNVALVYLDKRIHFLNTIYLMQINLAILHWNENGDRPTTSVRYYAQPGMTMQQQGKESLCPRGSTL